MAVFRFAPRLGLAHDVVDSLRVSLATAAELLELHARSDGPRARVFYGYAAALRAAAELLRAARSGRRVRVVDDDQVDD